MAAKAGARRSSTPSEAKAIADAALARATNEVKRLRLREVKNLFDAAAAGKRTAGWRTSGLDSNAENWAALAKLRDVARDMVRNNAYARRAKMTIQNNLVGSGIVPRVQASDQRITDAVTKHFETAAIHASGQLNLYGMQNTAAGMIPESGEALIRYRPRRREDGLPLPFQLQLLEGDYLDHGKNGPTDNGNVAISGVEFDRIGRRVAYWLFPQHPGSQVAAIPGANVSQRVDARYIAHIHRIERDAEEVRGMTWFAPVILRMRDFADFVDAQLMRQKIAACFSVFITDDGEGLGLPGVTSDTRETYPLEAVEPGMIHHLKAGQGIQLSQPPGVADFSSYSAITLREIAMGLGITYEALTGDLTGVNYSSGRMGWLEYQRNIDAWRWVMFIPQFLDRLTEWTNEAVKMQFGPSAADIRIDWTPPRREMIDPVVELEAAGKAIRLGLSSRSEEIRTLGRDPVQVDTEIAGDNERADRLDLVLDSDPRHTTANGNPVPPPAAPAAPAPDPAPAANAMAETTLRVVAEMNKSVAASIGETMKALAVSAKPVAQPPMSIVLDEKHITVDATRPEITDIEEIDDAGRIKSMIVRPVSGNGAVKRRKVKHDANGRLLGYSEEIIEAPTHG